MDGGGEVITRAPDGAAGARVVFADGRRGDGGTPGRRWGSARGYVPQARQADNGWQQAGQGWQGHGGQQAGWQQGSHGNQGQVQVPQQAPQAQQPQWPVRGNAHGAPVQAPIQNVVYRRDDDRGADQRQSHGQADGRGQFEQRRDANRDR